MKISRLLLTTLTVSVMVCCSDKPADIDNTGQEGTEDKLPEADPEPEPEPGIKPMLDIRFNSDGTAQDISDNNYNINTYDGFSLLTWQHPSYDGTMARFCHSVGSDVSDSYYKFYYYNEKSFKEKMSDGYSLEAIVMLDFEPDGAKELKAFCSTEQGGTGIMVASSSQGKQLTFLTNVSPNGNSNWVWGKTGVVPERGRYYHVIGVWDKENNEARVYLDGELKKTVPTSGSFNFPKSASCYWFCVGGDPSTTAVQSTWRGDVAMARVYDEALTTEWVQEHWNELKLNIPKATYLPKNVMYLTTCNIQPEGNFLIAGEGFESSDILEIESLDGTYKESCSCTADQSRITAKLPKDIKDGKFRLVMKRGEERYPIGITQLKISEDANQLAPVKVIAHRGYHKDGIPENSIAALAKAQEYGFYGSEVDVWITTDGVVVCNHDGVISSKTIQNCSYDEVKDLNLPTFEALLDQLGKSDATRLILEFKTHSSTERNNAVVDKALEMIAERNAEGMIDYIAFDYNICKRVVAALPEAEVGYLSGDKAPGDVYADGIRCIDYSYGTLNSHPEWIEQAHELGMKVNVWTVNSDNDLMVWIGKGVDYITTDNPDNLQVMIDTFCQEQ